MKLDLARDVAKFLDNLPAKQYRQVVSHILDLLTNPAPHDARPIQGMEGIKRVDVGEFRIAYSITGDVVRVYVVDKRNDDEIYKVLKRKFQ